MGVELTSTAAVHTLPDPVDDEELRHLLSAIPIGTDGYGAWWGTVGGLRLLEAIELRIGAPAVATVGRMYGVHYEPSDVSHTAIEVLSKKRVIEAVIEASNPWGYLYRTLQRELVRQVGPFLRTGPAVIEAMVVEAPGGDDGALTDVFSATELTIRAIAEQTPGWAGEHLDNVVHYLAARADGRLSRAVTETSREAELIADGFTAAELRAITRIVLGSRPNYSATSVLAGFVKNRSWNPNHSPAHRRALADYRARMQREFNRRMTALTAS